MNKKIIIVLGLAVFLLAGWMGWSKLNQKNENNDEIITVTYTIDEETVEAKFDNKKGTVTFSQKDVGEIILPRAISASGARYANEDESVVFWEHQGELTITKDGVEVFRGRVEGEEETGLAISDIIGTWMWEKTVMGDKSVVKPEKEGVFSLQFDDEGVVYGKTDCNSFRGTYETTEEKTITFGPLASTMMYCEGSQETVFTGEVSQADHYVFDESGNLVLNLNLDSGSMYFTRQ